MKYNEETFKEEVSKIYNGEIKIVGKYNSSTETFTDELLPTIKQNLIYDIVSTSSESQSSEESKDSNTDVN